MLELNSPKGWIEKMLEQIRESGAQNTAEPNTPQNETASPELSFPENEIEILDTYISDAFLSAMNKALRDSMIFIEGIISQNSENVPMIKLINTSRIDLIFYLDDPASQDLISPPQDPNSPGRRFIDPDHTGFRDPLVKGFQDANQQGFREYLVLLRNMMNEMSLGKFDLAEPHLNELDMLPGLTFNPDFGAAFNSRSWDFIDEGTPARQPLNVPGLPGQAMGHKPTPGITVKEPNKTLPAYPGPRPMDESGKRLREWVSFLQKGPERQFRVNLLKAEIHMGRSEFEAAIARYDELLKRLADGPRRKFIAIRSGLAHLALGDLLFRKGRNLNGEVTPQTHYQAAINLMQGNQIDPKNPRRQQIEKYATLQISKLEAGMNILGYRDSYVPVLRPNDLQELAERRIERARDAIMKFELFTTKADQLSAELEKLDFDKDIKEKEKDIAGKRIGKALYQKGIVEERINAIQSQLDEHDTDLFKNVAGSVVKLAATAAMTYMTGGGAAGLAAAAAAANMTEDQYTQRIGMQNVMGIAGAVGGFASAKAAQSAREKDLETQKRIAEMEKNIAERDVQIATLERDIVEDTVEFLGSAIQRIQKGNFNPDVYYAAAKAFHSLAERHLSAAIELAYLFERAVSFLRLAPEVNGTIKFDYLPLIQEEKDGHTLYAVDDLLDNLETVVGKNVPITKFQFLTETYSLLAFFPMEFNRFKQTGDLDFRLSLYELNKRRPGVWRQRIKRVEVEVVGGEGTEYTGTITHRGSFVLRDLDSTPEPGAGRFIPTDQELAAFFEQLKNGANQGMPIAGIMPFLLDADTIELSPDRTPPDLNDPDPKALQPIEGYGPAGDWSLKIENIDLRNISDVKLRLTYIIPESNLALAKRVRGLIADYEQELSAEDRLDLIQPFSLDATSIETQDIFIQLVEGQTASLSLSLSDFPSGITDLKLKTVVAQALDQKKNGIEGLSLEVSRPETGLNLVRSTKADGFSEDLTLEISVLPKEDRFPVEGTYTLRLTNPDRAASLNKLILFFVYEFKEI